MGVLVVEVERLTVEGDPSHGISWACDQLAKREPWRRFVEAKDDSGFGPDPGEALRQIYTGARDTAWATAFRKAFKFHEWKNALPEWEAMVSEVSSGPHFK